MLLVIVFSKWECDSVDQLFQNLLKASKEQGRAHRIIDLQPKKFVVDFNVSAPFETTQWEELWKAVNEFNEITKSVDSTASEAIRIVTEGTITSDIDAIRTVDEHLIDFESPNGLTDACLLAQKAQRLTDEYVGKAHMRYMQFIVTVIPNVVNIEVAFNNLAMNSPASESTNRQLEEIALDIRSINQRMAENVVGRKSELWNDVEKMALDVEFEYENIYHELKALLQK